MNADPLYQEKGHQAEYVLKILHWVQLGTSSIWGTCKICMHVHWLSVWKYSLVLRRERVWERDLRFISMLFRSWAWIKSCVRGLDAFSCPLILIHLWDSQLLTTIAVQVTAAVVSAAWTLPSLCTTTHRVHTLHVFSLASTHPFCNHVSHGRDLPGLFVFTNWKQRRLNALLG